MRTQTIARRLGAVETGMGGRGPRCPDCGGPGDGPGPDDTYELVFTPPEEAGQNEWCSCGRQTRVVLEWGNDQTS